MGKINGSNIMITGGTGFIGSHLVEELINTGNNLFVPYIKIERKSIFLLNNLQKKVKLEKIDITNKKKVFSAVKKYKINYIIHLAAQTIVTEAFKNPVQTLHTNIIGTVNVLEAVRNSKFIKGIIVASSDKAYGKTDTLYKEDSPLKGDHPYDVSKSCTDLLSQTYFKTYNLPIVITRFGNVYGEGDLHFDRILPGIFVSLIKKKTLEIRSNGKYIRDYIYVKDVVNGYMTLLKNFNKVCGQAFNFSSSDTLSVLELIRKVENVLGVKTAIKILNNAKNEIPYQHLDDAKIRNLGWKNNHNLELTLKDIYKWYRKII